MLQRADGHTYVVVLDSASAPFVSLPNGVEIVVAHVGEAPAEAASASGHRRLGDVLRMTQAARRARCDAFFFPSTYTWFPVPGTRTVVTVHDAIAEQQPGEVVPDRRSRVLWTLKQRAALRTARRVVTVSEAARDDLERVLRVQPDRLCVIHEAPDARFRPMERAERAGTLARHGLEPADPYVLYVGGISPHKNLEVLIDAFGRVAAEHATVKLLLVGDTDDDPFLSSTQSVRAAIAGSSARPRIALTGYLPDDDLVALYSGAVACVLPSLGEGFGLTAAESAACGTPVIASAIPALRELLGDTAIYAPATRPDRLAEGIRQLLDDPVMRERLSVATRARAATWSWSAAAETTVSLLEAVAND
jgi:glycosyltransferase involved in cell wall biosynthesis